MVLTYDDALNVHLDQAIPELDARGLKGSFYLSAFFPGWKNRIDEWRKAAANGHELGNHTLYQPCDASLPGRDWVAPENDLSQYSTKEILREIRMTNVFLKALDGKPDILSSNKKGHIYFCNSDFSDLKGFYTDIASPESLNLV